jgi:hypothetical protein
MDTPAEIRRWVGESEPGLGRNDVLVASGPLVIMAHGLLSIDRHQRRDFWIRSPAGDLSPRDAEEALCRWNGTSG